MLFLLAKKAIKDLEEANETHMPAYSELTKERNEVEAAKDLGLDARTRGHSKLESFDMRYIRSRVKIIKKVNLPTLHKIVICKVSAGEAVHKVIMFLGHVR